MVKLSPRSINTAVATVALYALIALPARAQEIADELEDVLETGEDASEAVDTCGLIDIACKTAETAKATVSSGLGKVIDLILALAVQLFGYLMDFFQRDPVTNPDSIQASIEWATDATSDLVIYAVAFSIIIGAGKVAIARVDQQMQQGSDTARAAILAAVAAATAAPILMVLIAATDALSSFLFEQAGDIDTAKETISSMLVTEESDLTTERLLLLIIAVMGIFAFLDLLMQLFLRQFLFIAATVFLPIAGAATTGDQGKAIWSAILRLLTGLLLFKPICALVFAIGIRYTNDNGVEGSNDFVTVLLFIAPVMALPILLQLVGGAGGNAGGGFMAAGGAIMLGRAAGGIGKKAIAGAKGGGKIISSVASGKGGSGGKGSPGTGGGGGGGRGPTGPGGGGGNASGAGMTGTGAGGGGRGATPPTPPAAMTNRSPASQPRNTPSATRPEKKPAAQGAKPTNGTAQGTKTPAAANAGAGAHSNGQSGAGKPTATSPTTAGSTSKPGAAPTPTQNKPQLSNAGQHRQRLSQSWSMYDRAPVTPRRPGGPQ